MPPIFTAGDIEHSTQYPFQAPARFVMSLKPPVVPKEIAGDWKYDVVSMGYPGFVMRGRPIAEPHNLAPGWVRFDFQAAFGSPVKVINDAAMQAVAT